MPISLRRDDSAEGNQIATILANLGTHVGDRETRIRIVEASVEEAKARYSQMPPEAAVFWIDGTTGSVVRMDKDGSDLTTLYTDPAENSPNNLALDDGGFGGVIFCVAVEARPIVERAGRNLRCKYHGGDVKEEEPTRISRP